ncbi:uncharacterized protein LOC124675756 [Lolium rigidum]|uniref:uncharacterized protein LOC124675756 n=1 Tax=Lolium rigidum TaxID=89674 RepID=UPI001F5C8FE8|nr:uncharacterized protein LOC124675756 [Lolium rigidum]
MESATRGRSAAAVDDVGDGRPFPDPLPPHGNETSSPARSDMAALVFRREQLLQELHRERIRHDMIMCELAETERVMTACLAGRGAWHGRLLMTPWEQTMYRTSRSSEETSWWSRSPSVPAIAPVYPCVERSPSPVLQPRPVDNAQKEECGMPLAVAPSAPPAVEQCPSLSKQPVVEEALVPAATSVVAKPSQPALLSKEVILESRGVVDHEHETEVKARHVMQQMQSGIQISEQLKRAAVDQEHEEEAAKDTHSVQLMGREVQRSEQPTNAALGQRCRVEAKDSRGMQLMECEIKSEQLKRAALGQEHEVGTHVRHVVQVTESQFRRTEQAKHGPVDQKHEAEVKSHDVQLMESEIHKSEEPKREAFGQEHEAEENDRHVVQLPKISEQPNLAEPTIKDHTENERRQLPQHYALAGKAKSLPNEQRRPGFNKPNTEITPIGVKGRQVLAQKVEAPPPKRHKPSEEWSCTHCQVRLTCQEDLMRHQAGDQHRLNVAALQSRQEPLEAKRASGFDLHNHFKGRSHQENTHAVAHKRTEPFQGHGHQESTQALHTEEGGKDGSKHAADGTGTEDRRKKFVTERSSWPFCELCKVQCNSAKMMLSHLRGKKHRENLQARH